MPVVRNLARKSYTRLKEQTSLIGQHLAHMTLRTNVTNLIDSMFINVFYQVISDPYLSLGMHQLYFISHSSIPNPNLKVIWYSIRIQYLILILSLNQSHTWYSNDTQHSSITQCWFNKLYQSQSDTSYWSDTEAWFLSNTWYIIQSLIQIQ